MGAKRIQAKRIKNKLCCPYCQGELPEPYVMLSPSERLIWNAIKTHSPTFTTLVFLVSGSISDSRSVAVILHNLRNKLLTTEFEIPLIKGRGNQHLPLTIRPRLVKKKNSPLPTYLKVI